ncbi:hypothetical protein ABIH81_23230 [Micromonospora sp. HUAS YX12]|uniref:DUF1579 domain-containing protein n=1 Tax=Micromonospora sp. HUAS YX12 TaxID=3156396 RepID=A0AAU7QWF9_9ACTN
MVDLLDAQRAGRAGAAARFTDGVGEFYADDTDEGRPVRCRFLWSGITADSCRWEQAFSTDGERTWETNWVMEFRRTG